MQLGLPFAAEPIATPERTASTQHPPHGTITRHRAPPRTLHDEVLFVRHPRARRYVIRVGARGAVRVTIPRGGSKREAQAFVERQQGWIEKQIRKHLQEEARAPDAIDPASERHLRDRAARELPARLLELASQHGLQVRRVSVRNQRWRWGSCARNGHICLNWRLVRMPAEVRDYVMIHELMHLKRMDHSPKFWLLVARACPNYENARKWLREHARNGLPVTVD
jgi:predicted metal-dependent hydrolase